jgi:hypothetical protein
MCISARSQALPTANGHPIEVGGAFTFAHADYGMKLIQGGTVFADAPVWHKFGAEVEYHYISVVTPYDGGENSILVGPTYTALRRDKLRLYAKVLGGIGMFEYQQGYFQNAHTVNSIAFAGGGGVEYRISRHINLRPIDVELQKWPNFGNGLSPIVFSIGAAYVP